MGWTSCMEKKIENYYGSQAATCAQGIDKGNLSKVADCIADVVTDTGGGDPAAAAVEILANLTEWSIDCEF
jgi:hypothetical protein